MTTKDMQEKFKEILSYGYQRGNEDTTLSTHDLVQELSEKMKSAISNFTQEENHK